VAQGIRVGGRQWRGPVRLILHVATIQKARIDCSAFFHGQFLCRYLKVGSPELSGPNPTATAVQCGLTGALMMDTLPHNYLLVSMTRDYADEFDVSGFLIVSESYFDEVQHRLRQTFGDQKICLSFGTNEELFWDTVDELIDTLVVTRLTLKEVECFRAHFSIDENDYPIEVDNFEQHIVAGFGECCFLDGIEVDPYDE